MNFVRPLNGVTVVDISRLLPGGFASLLLKDLGARVIKVEQPGVGDYYRAVSLDTPSLMGDQVEVINQGKESLALDLKSDEGKEVFLKLVRKADVVIENFRPGVLKRLGLTYPILRKVNTRVILCSLTGAGQSGPLAHLGGHDINYLGLSGLLTRLVDARGQIVIPDFQVIDLAAGYDAAMKILAAMYQRQKNKKGVWIDASMMEAGFSLSRLYSWKDPSQKPVRPSAVSGGLLRYGVYETSDARHVSLGALEPKFWEAFCRLIGKPQWSKDAMKYQYLGPTAHEELRKIFRQKRQAEWVDLGRRLDLCLFPVEEPPAWKQAVTRTVPALGQHTRPILSSLGVSKKQVIHLKEKGIIAFP